MLRRVLLFFFVFISLPVLALSENNPKRIVSLSPALTEEIYLLNSQDKLIADTVYCNKPLDAQKKIKIGNITTVNLENMLRLKPDLVLATSLTDRQQVEKMKALGINVVVMPVEKDFKAICENFSKLSKFLDRQSQAQEIIDKAQTKINIIRDRVKGLPTQKVFVQIGTAPLFAATKMYFINDIIELAGGVNIAHDAGIGIYNREEVLKQNPDIIIIAAMGIAAEEKSQWQEFKAINAVKNNKVYTIDPYRICSLTPITFVETLEEIVKILHP